MDDRTLIGMVADALAYGDEPIDDPLPDDTPTEILVDALHRTERIVAAAHSVKAHYKQRLADRVDTAGDYRYGETVYRVSPKMTRRVLPGEERALLEWLGDSLLEAVPASAVRITAVRAVAEGRGVDPRAVEDTFFVVEKGPAQLTPVPLDRAPKFLQGMGEGTHWRGKR